MISWKGGSTNWISLKDLKGSYPGEIAEYVKIKRLDKEPAFTCWVSYVLRKKQESFQKLNLSRCNKAYNTIQEILKFDKK